jgi:hypothetical protein
MDEPKMDKPLRELTDAEWRDCVARLLAAAAEEERAREARPLPGGMMTDAEWRDCEERAREARPSSKRVTLQFRRHPGGESMSTKIEQLRKSLQNDFRDQLTAAVREKFGIEVEHDFDFLTFRLVTTRVDEKSFTEIQHAWISAWVQGYAKATELVREWGRA